MEYQDIIFTKENSIAIVTLNRPPVNSIRYNTYVELQKVSRKISGDESIKAVIITGSGEKSFSAGADVRAFYELGTSVMNIREYIDNAGYTMKMIKDMEVPVIGVVNGNAFGGGLELLLACDFRISSENASFGASEVNLGIIPGTGGTVELPYIVGLAKAKEMVMLGRAYTAAQALEMDLVNAVYPLASLMVEAKKFAGELASKPVGAMKAAKLMLNTGIKMDWISARRLETEVSSWLMTSKDAQEGLGAFVEKRKPNFTGEKYLENVKKGMEFRGE
jgi:enoyl-CoA hydratase